MSHYVVAVITSQTDLSKSSEVLDEVDNLLAPFNEHIEIAPYRSYIDQKDVDYAKERAAEKGVDLFTFMAEYYDAKVGLDVEGYYYMSTYNPKSKWDWYVVGGRWNSYISGNEEEMLDQAATNAKEALMKAQGKSESEIYWDKYVYVKNPAFDLAKSFDKYANNSNYVHSLPEYIKPYGIITPDGEWHSKGRMGWFGMSSNEDEEWGKKMLDLFSQYSNHVVVGVDLHI